MSEKIYTIPINEAFDRYDGCPLCRLHDDLERSSVEYIMSPAMMETDVRGETNRLGFCSRHFEKMLEARNILGLALMLDSHLEEVGKLLSEPAAAKKNLFAKNEKADYPMQAIASLASSCYVCERIKKFEGKYVSNTVALWHEDEAFRDKLTRQSYFCLSHFSALLPAAKRELNQRQYEDFSAALAGVVRAYGRKINTDVHQFCNSFDYRKIGEALTPDQRDSVVNAIKFLK